MNFSNVTDWRIPEGEVIKVVDSQNRTIWEKQTTIDYKEPLYFIFDNSTYDKYVNFSNAGASIAKSIYISTEKMSNDYNWTYAGELSTDNNFLQININSNKVWIKAEDVDNPGGSSNYWSTSSGENNIYTNATIAGGNIASMINRHGSGGDQDSGNDYCFKGMLSGNSDLINVDNLIIPYVSPRGIRMFANILSYCNNITNGPIILTEDLYANKQCFLQAFYRCSNLSKITCKATTNIDTNFSSWVYGVSSTGTFYKAAGATWPTGNNGIPSGWTVQNI